MAGLFPNMNDVPSHLSTMTRLATKVPSEGFEPPTFGTGNRRSIP
jgi:hypothetical protein